MLVCTIEIRIEACEDLLHHGGRNFQWQDVLAAAGGRGKQHQDLDFFVPPPWAIAHHLVKIWAEKPAAWFSAKLW